MAVLDSNTDGIGGAFGVFSSFEGAAPPQQSNEAEDEGSLENLLRKQFGDKYKHLPQVYPLIIGAVEKDLQMGKKVMHYVSSTLSPRDRAVIIKSEKMRNHILGLSEFVRIVRSITATIGDLLGVDKDIDVQESTLSSWNNHAIIADVIVIEYMWSEIISMAVDMGIFTQQPYLESVQEIRSRGSPESQSKKCQLTLQPFENNGSPNTRSPVVWNGKEYMACVANFCANRMPELSIK